MIMSPAIDAVRMEFIEIVERDFHAKVWQLREDDQMRLLRLRVWSIRYKVSIAYILKALVPQLRRFTRRAAKLTLGVSIPVLTGKRAEEMLVARIELDFPERENEADWREQEKIRCTAIMQETIPGRPKRMLQFRDVEQFVSTYAARVQRSRDESTYLSERMRQQPWRGNPWR